MKLQIPFSRVPASVEWLKGEFPGLVEKFDRMEKRARIGLELDVKPMRERYTKEQQGAYWSSLHEFGRSLGYDAHESEHYLHPAICSAAYGVKDHRDIRVQGQTYSWPVPRETSSKDADGNVRDIETYSLLIDCLLRFAAEYGVVLEIRKQ